MTRFEIASLRVQNDFSGLFKYNIYSGIYQRYIYVLHIIWYFLCKVTHKVIYSKYDKNFYLLKNKSKVVKGVCDEASFGNNFFSAK